MKESSIPNHFGSRDDAARREFPDNSDEWSHDSSELCEGILQFAASSCRTPGARLVVAEEQYRWPALAGKESIPVSPVLDRLHQCTLLQKEIFIVRDTLDKQACFFDSSYAPDDSVRFYAGVPIRRRGGQAIGTLSVMDTTPRTLNGKQKNALYTLAQQVVIHTEMSRRIAEQQQTLAAYEAEERAHGRMEERMLSQVARLTALRAIDVSILSTSDLRQTLCVVLNQVLALLDVHAASMSLVNSQSRTLECAAVRGFEQNDVMLPPLHIDSGCLGQAIQAGETTIIWDGNKGTKCERTETMQREGFADYCAVPIVARGDFKGVLEIFHRSSLPISPDWIDFLMALAGQAAIAIENAALIRGMEQSNKELTEAYDTTIEGWSHALDLRDKETDGHCKRVTEMTLRLAAALGLSSGEMVHIRRGALLHDIGKMGVPDNILLKPGPLSEEEWEIMCRHPEFAYEMLSPISFLRPALDIPYYHHEKWDGTGYPHGLKGNQIPLAARIFAVVDVWDALCSDRPYRKGWPEQSVRQHLNALSGVHFDPEIVSMFLSLIGATTQAR